MLVLTRAILSFLNWFGYICTNVGMVGWNESLFKAGNRDVYVILFQATLSAVILSLIVALLCLRGKINRFSKANHAKIALNGTFSGIFFMFGVYCASPNRTPPFFQAMVPLFEPLFVAIFEKIWLKRSMKKYRTIAGAFVIVCIVTCGLLSIIPIFENGIKTGNRAWLWCILSITGIMFQSCNYVGQMWCMISIRNNDDNYENYLLLPTTNRYSPIETKKDYIALAFYQNLYQFLVILALCWTDFIPGFGDATSKFPENARDILAGSFLPWKFSEFNKAGLYALMFNLGYLVNFTSGVALNDNSPIYNSIVSVATAFGASFIYYMFPALSSGAMVMPWWSIWMPLIIGGFGVIGAGYVETKQTKNNN